MVGHQGNAYGSICGMFVDPVEHNGFVFLTNGAYAGKEDTGLYYVNEDIGRAVYEAFFGANSGDILVEPVDGDGTELVVEAPQGEEAVTKAPDAPEEKAEG